MIITSLSVIAENWETSKCPPVDKYLKNELNLGSNYVPYESCRIFANFTFVNYNIMVILSMGLF